MAIENLILSREGYSEISKLSRFISTLVIKNEAEAQEYETDFSYNNYSKYEASYSNSRTIYAYTYTVDDLKKFFPSDYIVNKNLRDPDVINKLVEKKDTRAYDFLDYLQKNFIDNYVEYNQYYRQFLGMPSDVSDRIYVENLDSPEPSKNMILITDVNEKQYPETYDYFFVKRNIDLLIEEYSDLIYLKFIEYPISPFRLRHSSDYTIFYYNKTILDSEELSRFNKAYTKARIYVTEQLYAMGQARRYPIYGNLVLLLILYYTICNYFNYKLEDYSLRKYTVYDIYDILESNGLKNLTKISDINILRKIVMNLDELNQYKGTEHALKLLFKILDDSSIIVKRYNLVKDYKVDDRNVLNFDLTGYYLDSVDIKFKETGIAMDDTVINTTDFKYVDYDSKTLTDDLWGGTDKSYSPEDRNKIKKELKKTITIKDFNEIKTKYLSLSKSINQSKNSEDVINILYLTIKYCYDYENVLTYNPLKETTANCFGFEINVATIFGAICYLTNYVNGLSDPENIQQDRTLLYSVYAFRNKAETKLMLDTLMEEEIDIGDPKLLTKVSSLISRDEIEKYIGSYNTNQYTTLSDIINEYNENTAIYKLLTKKIEQEENKLMLELWRKVDKFNRSIHDFRYVFDNCNTYSEFFDKVAPDFYKYITEYITREPNNPLVVSPLINELASKFETAMNTILNKVATIYLNSEKANINYLDDIKILVNEYVSIFSELYTIEQVINIDDEPNNRIKLSYQPVFSRMLFSIYENLSMRFNLRKQHYKEKKDMFFGIRDEYNMRFIDKFEDKLNFTFEKGKLRVTSNFNDKFIMWDENVGIKYKRNLEDETINLSFELINMDIKE